LLEPKLESPNKNGISFIQEKGTRIFTICTMA